MKKLILLTALFLCIIGCEKDAEPEPKYCWVCETYYPIGEVTTKQNKCDMTEKEIIKFEELETSDYWETTCVKR